MKLASLFLCSIVVLISPSSAKRSFINPYPRYKHYVDGDDPGDALYLTDIIAKDPLEAQKLAKVEGDGLLGQVQSYAGYLTVNKQYSSNTFFWYFPAEVNVDYAPVVLWLQGGPGASSLFGLFTENGPFEFGIKDQLKRRKYNWNHNHHLIYIDNPVGTGFSFTKDDKGYAKNEKDVGRDLYEAVSQFFTMFPKLQTHPFFITGESYAGKYVPALAYTIHLKKTAKKEKVPINLSGIAIGNGLSDPLHQLKYGDYLFQLGLIDSNGLKDFHDAEEKGVNCIKTKDMECAFKVFDSLINMDQSPDGSIFHNLTGFDTYYNYLETKTNMRDDLLGNFLQSSATRKAIHVGNNTFHDLAAEENKVELHLKLDIMDTVAPWIAELLKNYRVCIYNGQLDIIVAYPLTVNYLSKLKFDGDDDYKKAPRYIWKVDGEIAGYAKETHNIVEVLVRNAGHMAPGDQPKWVMDMLMRLTHGKSMISN